jgi:hypothetical protein
MTSIRLFPTAFSILYGQKYLQSFPQMTVGEIVGSIDWRILPYCVFFGTHPFLATLTKKYEIINFGES